MEYIYDRMISNSLNGKGKQQLKILLERYNNRLQTNRTIIDKAPKRSSGKYTHKVIEDTITRPRGRPKQNYTEEEVEALKQKKTRYYKKALRKKTLKKENIKKQSGRIIAGH